MTDKMYSRLSMFLLQINCLALVLAVAGAAAAPDPTLQYGGAQGSRDTPKDYAYSSSSSRVKDLVGFFEVLSKSSTDIKVAEKTLVVLSLPESASKLYFLTHGQCMEDKCNRYTKLLSRPNIRTVATISELMGDNLPYEDVYQEDANLMAKLVAERGLDPIARIQLFVQTLETERTLGKSNFEPKVEKDLLGCINYYTYRQQHASSAVTDYVRTSMESMPKSLTDLDDPAERFTQSMKTIESIELASADSGDFNYTKWLEALQKLRSLAEQNEYEVPQVVRDFLADPERVKRLNVLVESDDLKGKLQGAESNGVIDQSGAAYQATLEKLRRMCSNNQDIRPPMETCALLRNPERLEMTESGDKGAGDEAVGLKFFGRGLDGYPQAYKDRILHAYQMSYNPVKSADYFKKLAAPQQQAKANGGLLNRWFKTTG